MLWPTTQTRLPIGGATLDLRGVWTHTIRPKIRHAGQAIRKRCSGFALCRSVDEPGVERPQGSIPIGDERQRVYGPMGRAVEPHSIPLREGGMFCGQARLPGHPHGFRATPGRRAWARTRGLPSRDCVWSDGLACVARPSQRGLAPRLSDLVDSPPGGSFPGGSRTTPVVPVGSDQRLPLGLTLGLGPGGQLTFVR